MAPSRTRRRLGIATIGVVLAVLIPTIAIAQASFPDVPPGYVHAPGIDWVADAGITAGCGGGDYCPTNPVTRAQMATFLYRASGHAPGIAPSIDAATVQGLGPDDLRGEPGPSGHLALAGQRCTPGVDMPMAFDAAGNLACYPTSVGPDCPSNFQSTDQRLCNLSGFGLLNVAGSDLRGATMTGDHASSNLASADLQFANLAGADLSNTNFAGANLQFADFTGANLTGANRAANWFGATCPDGTVITTVGASC